MKNNLFYSSFSALFVAVALSLTAQTTDSYQMVYSTNGAEKFYYMYDASNNLSRMKQNFHDDSPQYQYFYNYTDNVLAEYYFIQYKEMGEWTDPKTHTFYTYDDQGFLVSCEDVASRRLYEYVYDEQGRLIEYSDKGKKSTSSVEYDKLYSTTYYSDFDENNKPRKEDYVHAMYAGSSKNTTYTYDEVGRVLTSETWKTSAETPYRKLVYTYDEKGIMTSMLQYEGNAETGTFDNLSYRETRTAGDNDTYVLVKEQYKKEEWQLISEMTEHYVTIKGEYAPRNLVVTETTVAGVPNSIALTCDVPVTEVPNAQYIIWRDHAPVATVEAVDGKITFTEGNLENVKHEYIVQSYDAVNNVYYNVSNPAEVEFATEIPTISNLHYIKTTEGVAYDAQGYSMNCYWVHFAWDAPETDLEITGYNIYDAGWAVPQKMAVNTCDSVSVYRELSFDNPDQQKEVTIEVTVVCALGESERVSETFTVEPSAVEEATVARVYVAGDYLVVDAADEVALYNVSGVKVAEYSNQSRIDLTQLPAGVYVARIEQNGKVQTMKIAR